jgi:hypothetical protein
MSSTATLDLDELSLIRKPRPWGWFVAGLLAIAGAGFVLAYHVPLRSAHRTLASEHEGLARKSAELSHALVETRAGLEVAAGKLHSLEVTERERVRAERSRGDEFEAISGLIQQGAKPLVSAEVLSVTSNSTEAQASLSAESVFPRGAKAVAPSLVKSLCQIVRPVKERTTLQLDVEIAYQGTLDAPGLALLSSQEGSLTSLMIGACKVPAERLRNVHFVLPQQQGEEMREGRVTFRYRSALTTNEKLPAPIAP